MREEKQVIESTQSIEHFMHVFICADDERANILLMIKNMYPEHDIELTREGFKVRVVRKKSEKEKEEYFKKHKEKTAYDKLFEEDAKPKKGKK